MDSVLRLERIEKSFGGFPALAGADFFLAKGEVHALLGENGAGKSSLMNVAAGLYAPDGGRVTIRGREGAPAGPRAAADLGIGMVHQHFHLVKPFTVAENVLLANPRGRFARGLAGMRDDIRALAATLGFAVDPDRRVETLSVAEQQRVEIVKVLLGGAAIVILDEPTAVLTDEEADGLLATMRRLAERGTSVVLVTHKLREVTRYADRVTVMRGGRTVATADPRAMTTAQLTELTVGVSLTAPVRAPAARGDLRLIVAGLRVEREDGHPMVADLGFQVRAGEIYGIAGVSGNGQSELVGALTGTLPVADGDIWLEGAGHIADAPPALRRAGGLAAIPADRYAHALAGGLSVAENYAITGVMAGRHGPWGWLDRSGMAAAAADAVRAFDVQGVRGLGQKAALLSGGNAQKLVIAREFARPPRAIVAHGPARGLDARACAAVHERLLAARAAGAAVVLVSDDLDEVMSLGDRIGVMTRGRIVAEFETPADRQAIGRAMVDHG